MLPHQSRGHGRIGGEKLALVTCEIDPGILDFRSQHIRFDLAVRRCGPQLLPRHRRPLTRDGDILVVE